MSPGDRVQVIKGAEQMKRLQSTNPHSFAVEPTLWCGYEVRVLNVTELGWFFLKDELKDEPGTATLNPKCVLPLTTDYPGPFSIGEPRHDISNGGKALGYVLPKTAALHATCDSAKQDLVTMLVVAGAELDGPDQNGDTAVHHAAG